MSDGINRRRFLGGTAAAVTGAAAMSGEAAAHYIGLPVYSDTNVNAREGPGTNYGVIATVEQYTGGRIIDGPVDADGYRWWKYRWNADSDNGRFVGWCATGNNWQRHANMAFPSIGYISSDYYSSRSYGYHSAVDIANDKYTNVYAGRGGYHTRHSQSGGCGNYSVIDHGSGYETLYCHLNSFVAGHGVNVSNFQHIGEMGTTGNSTGDHVHFQVRYNGDPVYVPGNTGETVYSRTGVEKVYSGLSRF
jgi:murein DD-endopeptidase MepM/ murein hydrolase activator NlpD